MEDQLQNSETALSSIGSQEETEKISKNDGLSDKELPGVKGGLPPGGRKGSKWLIPLFVLVLAGLIGSWFCYRYFQARSAASEQTVNSAIPVEVFTVNKGDIKQVTWFTGKVAPKLEIQLLPQISGMIEEAYVDIGDSVHAGDPLFRIDAQEVLNQTKQLEASLAAAQSGKEQARLECVRSEATLQQAQEAAALARNNLERGKFLLAQGAISQAEFEGTFQNPAINAEAGFKQAQALYDQACDRLKNSIPAQIAQAEAALDSARLHLDRTIVKAPENGMISARFADPGDLANPAQPLVTLVSLQEVKVTIQVTEKEINKIQKDQAVRLTIKAAGEQHFTGKVKAIAPAANAGTGLYQVNIVLSNEELLLKPGMLARVELATGLHRNALRLPAAAVLQKGGQFYVYKVENGRASRCTVTTGFADGDYLEIIKGLRSGDQVVVSGQEFLLSGSSVSIKKGDVGK